MTSDERQPDRSKPMTTSAWSIPCLRDFRGVLPLTAALAVWAISSVPYSDPAKRSADFQVCRIADFQVGWAADRLAGLETRDTADLEVCATLSYFRRCLPSGWSHFDFRLRH